MNSHSDTAYESGLAKARSLRSLLSALALAWRGDTARTSLVFRLVHGLSWQTFAAIAGRAGAFAIAVIQARLLGKAGYGELGMVLSTLILFGLFSSAVGGQTCTKFIAETRKLDLPRAERIATLSIVISIIFSVFAAVGIFACRTQLATQVLNAPQLGRLLYLAGVALSFQTLSGTASGVLLGFHEFRLEGNLRLVQVIAWLALTPWLSAKWGPFGAMLAYTVSHVVGLVAYLIGIARAFRHEGFTLRFHGMWAESRVLLHYSLPMALNGLLCMPTVWIGNAILARQPGGYVSLGGYTAAVQFRTVVLQLPMLIQGVVWPVMAELWGTRQMDRLRILYQNTYQVFWALSLLAALPMIAYGRIVLGVFGRAYTTDQQVLALVMTVTALSLLSSYVGLVLQAADHTWTTLIANVGFSIVSIVLAWILVPRYNALGLAVAFVVSTFVQVTSLLVLARMKVSGIEKFGHFGLVLLALVLCLTMQRVSVGQSVSALSMRAITLIVFMASVLWLGLFDPLKRVLQSLTAAASVSHESIPVGQVEFE